MQRCIYNPHSLRAATARLMLDANVDMVKVKELLGQAHIGDRMLLKDVQGKPLEAIEISLPVFARCKTAAW